MRHGFTADDCWVLVPCCRPENLKLIESNFNRQNYAPKHLLVVANGNLDWRDTIGMMVGHVVTLTSDAHQSAARNTGLDWLRNNCPDAYVANMDDDDWYGPDYLSEHMALARMQRINVKQTAWVLLNSGLWFVGHTWTPYTENTVSGMGGTIGSYVLDAGVYPMVAAAEEAGYLDSCRKRGCEVRNTSHRHYVYNRTGPPESHTYRASEKRFWRHMGFTGLRVDADPFDVIDSIPYGPAYHPND